MYSCYKIMLCQDETAIKTCAQCYIVYILYQCMSVFYISIISICIFFIVLYIEEKHSTTILKNL